MPVNWIERKTPPRYRITRISQTGVCGVKKAQANSEKTFNAPLISSRRRKPNQRISGVVRGLMVKLPTNTASTSSPEWKGSIPNPTWNSSGSRNGTALIEARNREPPYMVTLKVGICSASRRTIGHAVRRKCRSEKSIHPRPNASSARVCQPRGWRSPRSSMAATRLIIATEVARKPGRSKGRRSSSRILEMMRSDRAIAISPSGTLIKNIQCQLA